MRNPDRIEPVLELVAREWHEHPDMRLGQLLWAISGHDPFHLEDSMLARKLARKHDVEDPFEEIEYYE